MLINSLKSKISYATVTQKELFYKGSITIDENIMQRANIFEHEKVQIVNLNNGERLETYVIKGDSGSQIIGLNGPAARRVELGDKIFILSYALIDPRQESIEPAMLDLSIQEGL